MKTLTTWMTWPTLPTWTTCITWPRWKTLRARLQSPTAKKTARRAQSIADQLQALRTQQTLLEERERAVLPCLHLAQLERDRTAADIRMGEAWELAIAASHERYRRVQQEADQLARARAATGRAILALERRQPTVRRAATAAVTAAAAGAAVAPVLEQAPAQCAGSAGLPATAGRPEARPHEAVYEHRRGGDGEQRRGAHEAGLTM